MEQMEQKLSNYIQAGDKITIYTGRGSNLRLTVLAVDDTNFSVKTEGSRPNIAFHIFPVKISRRGIPYAEQA